MIVTQYHILVAFVISVQDLPTSATDVTIVSKAMSPFTAVKTVSNDYACSMGPGLTSTIAMSAAQCSLECNRKTSCRGFNLIDNDSKCAMVIAVDSHAMTYGVQQGCRFFIRGLGIPALASNYGTNVALNQPSIQYSTYNADYATLATDGLLSTGSCTLAAADLLSHWWAVDLGQPQHINVVQVSGDLNMTWRLLNLYVWLSSTPPTVGKALNTTQCTLCYQFSGDNWGSSPSTAPCPITLSSFRYVILQSFQIDVPLCFHEVQVFMSNKVSVDKPGTNVALKKAAIQCTTYSSMVASLATDGLLSTTSCTYPIDGISHWWAVDLGQPQNISVFQVSGDTSFTDRLNNLYVWLSNTQPTVGQALDTAQCSLCYQFSGGIPVDSPPTVPCPITLSSFRYVILQSSYIDKAICFREVQVFIY